jgi:hypothetical protein
MTLLPRLYSRLRPLWRYRRIALGLALYGLVALRLWRSGWHPHALVSFTLGTLLLGGAWADGSLPQLLHRLRALWHWPIACHAGDCPACGTPLPVPTNADRWELTQVQESAPDARGLWQRCPACGWEGAAHA